MSEQTAAKGTGAHLARRAYLYLLTELPEQPVQFRGQAVVGVVMVPVRDRKRRGRSGSRVVDRAPGRPHGRVRRCVGAVAAARPGGVCSGFCGRSRWRATTPPERRHATSPAGFGSPINPTGPALMRAFRT